MSLTVIAPTKLDKSEKICYKYNGSKMKYTKYLFLAVLAAVICVAVSSDCEASVPPSHSVYEISLGFENTLPESLTKLPEQLKINEVLTCIFEKMKFISTQPEMLHFNFLTQPNIMPPALKSSHLFRTTKYIFQLSTQLE